MTTRRNELVRRFWKKLKCVNQKKCKKKKKKSLGAPSKARARTRNIFFLPRLIMDI